jgi:hypothetical protein
MFCSIRTLPVLTHLRHWPPVFAVTHNTGSCNDYISAINVPTYIYHLGDFDPSGVNAGEKIEETLREMAPNAVISFERIAVNIEQVIEWNLPTRPTKQTDTRAKKFGSAESVELDAIDPRRLRSLVGKSIQQHLPRHQFKQLMRIEQEERKLIGGLVGMLNQKKAPTPFTPNEISAAYLDWDDAAAKTEAFNEEVAGQ